MYYDIQKVLSYNAYFYFLLGERGVGKTYSTIKFVVNRFIKKNEQFIYLRRYKTEVDECKKTFFNKIQDEFPDHLLITKGHNFYCDDHKCGYIFPLSTSNILKSVNFDKVTTIIFDEFIIDKGTYHYLQNEVETFLEFVETVFRLRENVRVIFLANAITQVNPYFLYFDIKLPYNKTIKTFKDGLILLEIMKNLEYREVKKKSKLGRLTAGTNYSNYAIDNQFLRDNNTFIEKKGQDARFNFYFTYKGETFGVWNDYNAGKMYISSNYDKTSAFSFSTTMENHQPNMMFMKNARSYTCWKMLIEMYKYGALYFENQKIKTLSEELIKQILC